jgi:3-oxoacyl-[acyl-carrier-protein] synthase II
MTRRVVVTGVGVCSPLGNTVAEFSRSLFAGRSAVGLFEAESPAGKIAIPAAVCAFDAESRFTKLELMTLDRIGQMALLAADEALAGYPAEQFSARTGVYVGCGMGGANHIESVYRDLFLGGAHKVRPTSVVNIMANAPAGHLAIRHRARGTNVTFSNACASSANAIGEAMRAIRHGYIDAAIAGGTEGLLVFGAIHAWRALGVLAPAAADVSASCRPFAADRAGLVLGEGAAILLLEAEEQARARGAPVLAEIVGYGTSCDASHLTKPASEGQITAMQAALAEAQLAPSAISYINAHGTATQVGDIAETQAIKAVFGAVPPPVSSTKSMHGHLLGAAGALEAVASICALREQMLPPTVNLQRADPQCDLDYVPNTSRQGRVDYALSNSFAFGGSNASLILARC